MHGVTRSSNSAPLSIGWSRTITPLSRTADHLKRIIDVPRMGIVVYVQQINYGKRLVYAHQGFSVGINGAFYQRQVGGIHGLVQIGDEAELAV